MTPPDNQYKIFSAVENKVTEASTKVLKNALQYDTDGKSGETIKVYQEYAMVSGVTSDTINSRIRSIQNAIGEYLKSVDKITKKAVETHATQRDIRNIQWAIGAATETIKAFESTSSDDTESYNESRLKKSLQAHKGIYRSDGKELSVYDLVKDIPITNRYEDSKISVSRAGKEEFSHAVTEKLEDFQRQKIDRAKEYITQISDAQTKLQSALNDLNYTEKDIRDGKIPRPSPGVSSFTGLDAAAKGKVDLTKLGTATLGSLPEVVAGKNPADLTKTATEKTPTSSDDTPTTTEEKKDEGTQNQSPSNPGNSGAPSGNGSSGTGGDRSGRPGGTNRKGDKKSSDSGSGEKNGKSAEEILNQLAQASQQATTGVMNAAAPVVNPALNAMGMPGIGQPGGIGYGMPGVGQTMPMGGMGSMFGAPGMGSQFGAPGMGAPGAGSQFGAPGMGAPGAAGAPGSNLGGGLGGQNHTAPTVGAPSQARVDPAVGQQLRADSAQAMKNTDNLVRDTAKKLDDTAQKLEDEAKAKDKEAAEKKPPAPEDKPKPEDKPAGEQPPAPEEGEKKPEEDAAPAPEGEKNPEGGKPADEGAGDNAGETEQPAPEGEEAPPEGGDDAADNPEENPDAGTGEPPAEDPSVHVEATGTITRDGVTFQVDDARIAAVVDDINPQDGSTAIPLREAVINAGFNVPESGPMGTPVSPTDVQPGDIIVAAGAEGVLTGEGSVITANGKMALSDVASFENPEDGIYRL